MRKVALIYDARLIYDVKVMTGVADYLQEVEHYSIYIQETVAPGSPAFRQLTAGRVPTSRSDRLELDLRSWNGDGIIANFDDPVVTSLVMQSHLPAVAFGGGYGAYKQRFSIPYFYTNNDAIAALAADHLIERGFKSFAYCGYPRTAINGWSEEREDAFVKHVAKAGCSCPVFRGQYGSSHKWAVVQRSLGAWLQKLPKPVGIMAANDNRGLQVLEACRECDIHVPEDVAVIGVDNHELLCRLTSPPLTSVEQGARQLGYAAAALLAEIMEGRKPKRLEFVIDPAGVVTRHSTDVLAIEDPRIAQAMRYIREHACEGILVPDVVNAVGISRSSLETRFAATLGYTIRTAIRRIQLERARRLILDSDLPLKQVADVTGLKTVQRMTTVFAKAFGETPAKYRQLAGPTRRWNFASSRHFHRPTPKRRGA